MSKQETVRETYLRYLRGTAEWDELVRSAEHATERLYGREAADRWRGARSSADERR
jgi:hypothetical protein